MELPGLIPWDETKNQETQQSHADPGRLNKAGEQPDEFLDEIEIHAMGSLEVMAQQPCCVSRVGDVESCGGADPTEAFLAAGEVFLCPTLPHVINGFAEIVYFVGKLAEAGIRCPNELDGVFGIIPYFSEISVREWQAWGWPLRSNQPKPSSAGGNASSRAQIGKSA